MKKSIILIIYIIALNYIHAQDYSKVSSLTKKDGLSWNNPTCIYMDYLGFIWIGTKDGLKRYDGKEIISFGHVSGNSTTLSSSYITNIAEDVDSNLWIGTNFGLNLYSREKDHFKHFFLDTLNPWSINNNVVAILVDNNDVTWVAMGENLLKINDNKINGNYDMPSFQTRKLRGNEIDNITCLYEDEKHNFWIGTKNNGFYLYDRTKDSLLANYRHDISNKNSLPENYVNHISNYDKNILFISTYLNELCLFDTRTGKVYNNFNTPDSKITNIESRVEDIYKDKDNNYWIANATSLLIYNSVLDSFIYNSVNSVSYKKGSFISKDQVRFVYNDRNNITWIGYGTAGVDKYDPNQDKFSKWLYSFPSHPMYRDYVLDIHRVDSIFWIGTYKDGLIKYDYLNNQYIRLTNTSSGQVLSDNIIYNITPDERGMLWVGTHHGLNKIDPSTNKVTKKIYTCEVGGKKYDLDVLRFTRKDSQGYLWILSQDRLLKFDPVSENFVNDPIIQNIKFENVFDFYEDKDGDYWFISDCGAAIYRREVGDIQYFNNNPMDEKTISGRGVFSIYQDNKGYIWFGTNFGLSRYDKKKNAFKNFYKRDGLTDNGILKITGDEYDNIWILSLNGLTKFNPRKNVHKRFTEEDGLFFKTFFMKKSKSGKIFLAGEKAFLYFDPDSIKDNQYIPPVYFTSLSISGKKISAGEGPLEHSPIYHANEVVLQHSDNPIEIEFSALNYTLPKKNQYAYKLGEDSTWHYLGNNNKITFMNLNPGTYELAIKASNNDNVWNDEGANLNIRVLPPWWQTWWAYLLYSFVIAMFLVIYKKYAINREKLKNQLKMQTIHAQQVHEMDQMKLNFFMNISHELRTPLSLIIAPLKRIIKHPEKGGADMISMVYENALKLQQLINQVLDLRKIDMAKMKPELEKGDVLSHAWNIAKSFETLSSASNIQFSMVCHKEDIDGYFDADKLDKILSNLLSNAFKYTREKGLVRIEFNKLNADSAVKEITHHEQEMRNVIRRDGRVGDYFQIQVHDNGEGMPENEIEHIFDRFYQSSYTRNRSNIGSGIGLSLVLELVKLLKGLLFVQSNHTGTSFIVLLPLSLNMYNPGEVVILNGRDEKTNISNREDEVLFNEEKIPPVLQDAFVNKKILVVEDNRDMLNYLENLLQDYFTIIQATNGETALEILSNKEIDLVLSDVMMSPVNGVELCKKIKADEELSYLPVLLLTAKGDLENEKEGLAIGADDYITKPFDPDILVLKLYNHFRLKKKIWDKFNEDIDILPKDLSLAKRDEAFLKNMINVVEKHLDDYDFGSDELFAEIGVSRTHAYRKLKNLTNQSVNEFIRTIRLKKAAHLLKCERNISIAELGYAVGFSNPNYFTRSFTKYFGMSPKKYNEHFHQEDLQDKK